MATPFRGEVWMVHLDPTRGHEQAGRRPGLIVSVDPFNQGPGGMTVIMPLTTKEKHIPLHVRVEPPEGGLSQVSFIRCEDVRSVSQERLIRRVGQVSPVIMATVEDCLRLLLGL